MKISCRNRRTFATASPDGTPHAATFMYVNEGPTLYFWARAASTTVAHLSSNPRTSFAIDEYVEDWNRAKGIQGACKTEQVVLGDEVAKAVGLFADKFPSPSSGASTTNTTFFKVTPSTLQFIDNIGTTSVSDEEFGMDFHRVLTTAD